LTSPKGASSDEELFVFFFFPADKNKYSPPKKIIAQINAYIIALNLI